MNHVRPNRTPLLLTRRTLLGSSLALAGGVMVGCSSSGKTEENASAGPVTVSFAQATDPARLAAYESWVSSWNSSNPDIQVDMSNTPYGPEYFQKLQIQAASKSMPDIWLFSPGMADRLLEGGQILDVNPMIKAKTDFDVKDLNQSVLSYVTRDDKIYGLPYDVAAQVIYYNKAMLDQLKIPYPEPGWTWQDLSDMAAKLKAGIKPPSGKTMYGIAMSMNGDWTSDSFYRSWGTQLIDDSNKIGINNSAGVDTITFVNNLVDQGISPKPVPGANAVPNNALFVSELAGLLLDGGWSIPTVKDGAKFDWDMVSLPTGPGGPGGVTSGGLYSISASCPHPQQAFDFLSNLTGTEGLSKIVAEAGGGQPGRYSAEAAMSTEGKKLAELVRDYPGGRTADGVAEVWELQSKTLQQVWNGSMSPQDAVAQIEDRGNQALKAK